MPEIPFSTASRSHLPKTAAGWLLPGALLLLIAAIAYFAEPARQALRFDREALYPGFELWRLLTGHLAHLGGWHALLNGAGLLLVWLLVGSSMSWRMWLLVLLVCALGVDAGLWWGSPALDWYVGLSGVLHGLLVAGLIAGLEHRRLEGSLLLVATALKLAYEQWAGPLPGSGDMAGGPVVVDAHLYGALAGLTLAVIVRVSGLRQGHL